MRQWNEEYRIRTQADLTRRTSINRPDYSIKVTWNYPKDTMHSDSTDIVASGWCTGGDDVSSFHLEIENPLESSFIKQMLEPCLVWMKEHGALEDENIEYNFRQLMRHANTK